ncbi:MAG: hypothetical protein O3B04_04615 [Chloroflexi bacterium]|nr:hypothetical protein [Chloroflexota bacterium]MDA1297272.1 hypothetical protein [Chloroflexota bacterium]
MARVIIASLSVADSVSAVQLQSAPRPRVRSVVFKARVGNIASIYLASDSAAKSAGFELAPGDREEWCALPATLKGSTYWIWGASSGDRLDYALLLEE